MSSSRGGGFGGLSPVDVALLVLCITCNSMGPSWFALMSGDPSLRACWRLQLTFLLQLGPCAWEVSRMDAATRARWARMVVTTAAPTGVVLGLHFSSCAFSVAQTSLSHAILTMNLSPLAIVVATTALWAAGRAGCGLGGAGAGAAGTAGGARGGAAALEGAAAAAAVAVAASGKSAGVAPPPPAPAPPASSSAAQPPTRLESFGAALALLGLVGLVSAAAGPGADEARASWRGDAWGLLASASMAAYLVVGKGVRAWCGLFAWTGPLNAFAALACGAAALATAEGVTLLPTPADAAPGGPRALLAWTAGGPTLAYALGAAATSGILGHGTANLLMSRLSALVVSTVMLLQPPLAMVLGYAIGLQGRPGLAVLLTTPLILYGGYLVTVGDRARGLSLADALACRVGGRAPADAAADEDAEGGAHDGRAPDKGEEARAAGAGRDADAPVLAPAPAPAPAPADAWGSPGQLAVPRLLGPGGLLRGTAYGAPL